MAACGAGPGACSDRAGRGRRTHTAAIDRALGSGERSGARSGGAIPAARDSGVAGRVSRGGRLVRFARAELCGRRARARMRGGHGAIAIAQSACVAFGKIGGEEVQFEWVPGMKCTEFENVVVDIARGALMEAGARRDGLAHATGCERCGRRLVNERALSGLLAVTAAEDAGCT